MKKRIGSKMYSTETARLIAEKRAGSGFRWIKEQLYVKRTGEVFLFALGGPASWYSHRCKDGSRVSGCGIVLLGRDYADAWLEWGGDLEDYPLPKCFIPCGFAGCGLDGD